MRTISETLNRIGADILKHLLESKKPLTQYELYQRSEISSYSKPGLSEFGWGFALEKLERKHLIEMIDDDRWQLKNGDRTMYLKTIEEMTGTKVYPD